MQHAGELSCVLQVAQECKLTVDVEDYVNSFRADLMNATAAWCRGARFAEVLKMSDVFEVGLPQTALLWCHLLDGLPGREPAPLWS